MKWATEILECSPISIRASKQAAMMGLSMPLDAALRMNFTEAERMRRSEDTIEGPKAFAEKRKPNWKGR
jgi:crotonobetainyl-CoA hydratase